MVFILVEPSQTSCWRFAGDFSLNSSSLLTETAARRALCDCLVVPCCNGKILSSQEKYPRSSLVSGLITEEDYSSLSSAADDLSLYSAKCLVEFDRGKWAEENGARVEYLRLEPVSASPKHLVLYCQF